MPNGAVNDEIFQLANFFNKFVKKSGKCQTHTSTETHTSTVTHTKAHTSTVTHTGRGTWLLIKTPLMQLGIWLEQ